MKLRHVTKWRQRSYAKQFVSGASEPSHGAQWSVPPRKPARGSTCPKVDRNNKVGFGATVSFMPNEAFQKPRNPKDRPP